MSARVLTTDKKQNNKTHKKEQKRTKTNVYKKTLQYGTVVFLRHPVMKLDGPIPITPEPSMGLPLRMLQC